jgi:hypothetical protein
VFSGKARLQLAESILVFCAKGELARRELPRDSEQEFIRFSGPYPNVRIPLPPLAEQHRGITDYYSTAVYKQVLKQKSDGHLNDVALIFPNVEMRFGIETAKASAINVHLERNGICVNLLGAQARAI